MRAAQQNFVLSLEMRRDGIQQVAANIGQALGSTTSKDAVDTIAAGMARFYASDVVYKDYTGPLIAAALHAVGIAVGGVNGVTIAGGQFLHDLGWLTPAFVAAKLGAQLPAASGGQAGARGARPRADFGQRRRDDAPDRFDQHDPRQPSPDVHLQLHQRRGEH